MIACYMVRRVKANTHASPKSYVKSIVTYIQRNTQLRVKISRLSMYRALYCNNGTHVQPTLTWIHKTYTESSTVALLCSLYILQGGIYKLCTQANKCNMSMQMLLQLCTVFLWCVMQDTAAQ